MAIKLNSPGWNIQPAATTRGLGAGIPSLPPEFLTQAKSTEEFVAQTRPAVRGAAATPSALDITYELSPGESAVLALRHASGALTFHAPRTTTSRTRGGPVEVRFIAPIRPDLGGSDLTTSRGVVSKAIKAVIVKVAGAALDAAVGFVLSKLALAFETAVWKSKGLKEGWLKVTKGGLVSGRLDAGKPSSTERSLLLVHGTFSNASGAFASLAKSNFLEEVAPLYGDRIFAFDHFSISRTPEENVRMLLKELPDKAFTFDVITHSRGGLVLRNLVERRDAFGALASRFTLGRAIIVAAPNEGTPLATPSRWEDTVGWVANLLELFPENPFTTGAEFVAHGLVWIARHASGDLPGIHSMDGDGDLIRELQSPPGPPADRYSVLAANYNPGGTVLERLLDMGIDQFFNTANDLVVPSEGGWRVDPSGGTFIPGSRIGCFGPGGNIDRDDVTHVNFFAQPETVAFLVAALNDQAQKLAPLDPAQQLPDRRLLRAGAAGVSVPAIAGGRPVAAKRARFTGRAARAVAAEPEAKLGITVINGDLTFEERPLLVGHYRATRLSGTEKVVDRLLDRAMTNALDARRVPGRAGYASHLHQSSNSDGQVLAGATPGGGDRHRPWSGRQAAVGAHRSYGAAGGDCLGRAGGGEGGPPHRAAAAGDHPAVQRRYRRDARSGCAAHRTRRVRSQRADSSSLGAPAPAGGARAPLHRVVFEPRHRSVGSAEDAGQSDTVSLPCRGAHCGRDGIAATTTRVGVSRR